MNFLTEDNLASGIETLIVQASSGLRAARDAGHIVHNPDTIDIEFIYLVQANAITQDSTTTTVEPAITTTETRTTPEVIETSSEQRPAVTSTRTEVQGAGTRNEVSNPSTVTTEVTRSGGNEATEETVTTVES